MSPEVPDDKFSDEETKRRLDAALAKSLKMKPKPHKAKPKTKARPKSS
jgi:hypothetical protein